MKPVSEVNKMTAVQISQCQIDTFQRDGAICLRKAFPSKWLESLARGVTKNFENPGPYSTQYTARGQPGGFYDDYCNWQKIDEYREFVMSSPAAEIAARLTGSDSIRIYHEHVLVKEPDTREVTPWHHDLPYWGVEGNQLCSIWLPLDPVPKTACPEFVAQSHNSGVMYYPRLFINHENYASGYDGFETIPDIDGNRSQYNILSWDLEPGDCIVFHMRTIHGAPSTIGLKTRRRGFSTRWLGNDAVYADRPWTTSPPFEEVTLNAGAPMEHPAFPVVWTG